MAVFCHKCRPKETLATILLFFEEGGFMNQTMKKAALGVAAGAASGLLASWIMEKFMMRSQKLFETEQKQNSEPATEKVANQVTQKVTGKTLPETRKAAGGEVVHYAFGAAVGAVYGLIGAFYPPARFGLGLPYGIAVFLLADEVMVPALGLAKGPTETPLPTHLKGFAAHLVYGAALSSGERLIRSVVGEKEAKKPHLRVA
jgi:uncharacterized membrane protein YagU involved in acid resistance